MKARRSLEQDVLAVFERACRDRDWEIAEFLFQALEAISDREGDASRMEPVYRELLDQFTSIDPQTGTRMKRIRQ